jgi:hypothetical protein
MYGGHSDTRVDRVMRRLLTLRDGAQLDGTLSNGVLSPRFIAQNGNPGAPLLRVSVAGCYSLRITLKRPLLTVNAPLPV